MGEWIIPCNLKYYDVAGAFEKLQCINWKQSIKDISVGDTVYIYVGAPIKAIKYKCRVNKTNLTSIEIDDSEFVLDGTNYVNYGKHMELQLIETYDASRYSLNVLRENGLNGSIQGPRRVLGILG